MEVCAEPVFPADCGGVWESVDLDAGAQGAEGDGVALVADNHMVPHWAGTTSKILEEGRGNEFHSTDQPVRNLGKSPGDAIGETTQTGEHLKYAWADKEGYTILLASL